MSAKGHKRGDGTSSPVRKHEFYPTPRPAIDALITSRIVTLPGGAWIDPCAGDGAIPEAVNARRPDVTWDLVEIDEAHAATLRALMRRGWISSFTVADFLASPPPRASFDVAIMNPPFSLALAFVNACRRVAAVTVMLQRLNWMGPARAEWMRTNQPDVYPLPKRPSFTGDGKTDAAEYAWFVWDDRIGECSRGIGRVAMLGGAP